MNNPNPFVPQGSLLEQKNKKRARVKVVVFSIFAVNILVISPLLIQGCSKDKDKIAEAANQSTNAPAMDANTNAADANLTAQLPAAPATNVAAVVTNAPPPPVPPAEVSTTREYVVEKNDSFYSIAKKFGVKTKDVEAANPGVVPTKLKVGQKLQIPPAGASVAANTSGAGASDAGENIYVVKSGDSLSKIAKEHGVSWKSIRDANDLKTNKIKVGDKLKIPAKTATADTSTTPATGAAAGAASTNASGR